jgi:hypothetical protein
MIDPLTIILVGAGALAFREMNKKDYGVLTPSRDERYRNVMEHCHDPEMLLREAQLFAEHGLKAQAAMLKRRAEWRARPQALKEAHEEIYQKALKSTNIPAILEVASAFEGWTATKKAGTLRDRVTRLQEDMLQDAARRAAESVKASSEKEDKTHLNGAAPIPQNTEATETKAEVITDDI